MAAMVSPSFTGNTSNYNIPQRIIPDTNTQNPVMDFITGLQWEQNK
jgi:hypothetical protein